MPSAAHHRIFDTAHSPKGEVVTLPWNKAQILPYCLPGISGESLQIFEGGGSRCARFPEYRAQHRLQHIRQPEKGRLRVSDREDGHAHRHQAAFRQRLDLQRQIPEIMQIGNMLIGNAVLSQVRIHPPRIFLHDIRLGPAEEVLIELTDQVFLEKILQSENTISFNAGLLDLRGVRLE